MITTKLEGSSVVNPAAKENTKQFIVKDSGVRAEYASGMVRDIGRAKVRYNRCLAGPMFERWAKHLHKGEIKYPDVSIGVANWMLASGEEELQRFKESALGHMIDWLKGKTDEDHAAALFFNINGAEYVKEVMANGNNEKDRATKDSEGERRDREEGC